MRGATKPQKLLGGKYIISIHAPLAGCDPTTTRASLQAMMISIHAPLAGCDWLRMLCRLPMQDFNPRTPCGVRPHPREALFNRLLFQSTHPLRGATSRMWHIFPRAGKFQSTHPLRGATIKSAMRYTYTSISIHAPLAGCDCSLSPSALATSDFNPRTPCGVRR